MKQAVVQLKEDGKSAKMKQDEASKEIKRIEKDMKEFNSNKGSKLAELQSSLDKLKKALAKNNTSVKPLQSEMREAMVESEQCSSDLVAAQEQYRDVEATLKAQQEEVDALMIEQAEVKVSYQIHEIFTTDDLAGCT
jgi:structural maintenance of chromosome 2